MWICQLRLGLLRELRNAFESAYSSSDMFRTMIEVIEEDEVCGSRRR